jgi:hypothetical protein
MSLQESFSHQIILTQIWGPFHGVPITVKENNDVGGLLTTVGNPIFAGRVATVIDLYLSSTSPIQYNYIEMCTCVFATRRTMCQSKHWSTLGVLFLERPIYPLMLWMSRW